MLRHSAAQGRTITPRPSRQQSLGVLCEAPQVRAIARADGRFRFLQFRGTGVDGSYPWRNNEAIVKCEETCPSRIYDRVSSADKCTPCRCTPAYPPVWSLYGFGYVQLMFDTITKHDTRCRDRPSVDTRRFRVLQIGLGGGTFATAIRRKCDAEVDVIEGQADVAAIAQQVFGYEPSGKLIVADGLVGLCVPPHCAPPSRPRAVRPALPRPRRPRTRSHRPRTRSHRPRTRTHRPRTRTHRPHPLSACCTMGAPLWHGRRQLERQSGVPALMYDAVAIDCMIQGATPSGCKSAEFVQRLARLMRPRATLAQWAWGRDRTTLARAYSAHFANVSDVTYSGIGGVLQVRGKRRVL
jgi:hypothetical protein